MLITIVHWFGLFRPLSFPSILLNKLTGVAKEALEDAVDNFSKKEYRDIIEAAQKEVC